MTINISAPNLKKSPLHAKTNGHEDVYRLIWYPVMTARRAVITEQKNQKIKSLLNGACAVIDPRSGLDLIEFEVD